MLISQLKGQCKDKGKTFQKGRLFLVQQNSSQTGDFLTTSWLIHQLQQSSKVTFFAFRQNYAHYLNLSKKLGKSIQPFIKSKQLRYYEFFQSLYNQSELPLTQTSPNTYIAPPTSVTKMKQNQILKKDSLIQEENSFVIIDAASFTKTQIVIKIYEEAMDKNCRILIAGIMQADQIINLFKLEADLYFKLQNDVGNYGRFKLSSNTSELTLLWKYLQGKFDLTQHVKL